MYKSTLIILVISFLGPIIGSFIGVMRKPTAKSMYNMLAFAGGVMLAVSFLQLIPESIRVSSIIICTMGIGLGSFLMFVTDKLIPHIHPELCSNEQGSHLKKTSLLIIIGIFLHNIPEGMAVAVGTISGAKAGIILAIAIAIQNIPEGICTSAPYFYCTKKRLKAFLISSSTSIPILFGFFLATLLYKTISSSFIGLIIGATAGIMIYITADELIPNSCAKSDDHSTIFSLILGILLVVALGMF